MEMRVRRTAGTHGPSGSHHTQIKICNQNLGQELELSWILQRCFSRQSEEQVTQSLLSAYVFMEFQAVTASQKATGRERNKTDPYRWTPIP